MEEKEFEKRFNELFDKLVPVNGKSDTNGGEIIRAVARVQYRWYNDGDMVWVGYGRQTVNPAVRFLYHVVSNMNVTDAFKAAVEKIYKNTPCYNDERAYEIVVDELVETSIECVEKLGLGEVPNSFGDMWDYKDEEYDVDSSDDDDDCYEDDEF